VWRLTGQATGAERSRELSLTDLGACPATLLPDLTAPTEDEVREAVAASAKAGCTELSVWAQHVPWMGDLSALGLRVRVLEGATAWANGSASKADAEAETFAQLASTLGAPLVMAFALDAELTDPHATRRNLQRLIAAVDQVGARLCLEFLPFGGVPDLATAWQLIEPLGPGAALTIDTWHWTRQPGGPAPELLSTIPGDRIGYVQVSDVAPVSSNDMALEAGFGRLLPGEGVVDFGLFFGALRATGADPFVAPEVFSQSLVHALGAYGAAEAALAATHLVLRA
jgi:sugar phosphate isomerase/epimerase